MSVAVEIRNASGRRCRCRRDVLRRLAERVCAGERVEGDVEVSVLLCDDDGMRRLNRAYRKRNRPTDVLAFLQRGPASQPDPQRPAPLGDIAISLETVARRCESDAAAMREEVRLLFCHGLLHLLGYDHADEVQRSRMIDKQAQYLDIAPEAAWLKKSAVRRAASETPVRKGGSCPVGR